MSLKTKSKAQFVENYEDMAASYDTNRSANFEGRVVDALQRKLIRKIATATKSKKVCEAGCGTGRILVPLSHAGFECYGFDPSKKMMAQLKSKTKSITTKVGDIEKIPFKANTFDLTYTMHVLMHLPKHDKAIQEMIRITKKGGHIILDFPHKSSPWTKLALFLSPNKERTHLFTRKDIQKLLKGHEYKVTGLFSYPRTAYHIPVLRHVAWWLERFIPLPIFMRTQLIAIVKK